MRQKKNAAKTKARGPFGKTIALAAGVGALCVAFWFLHANQDVSFAYLKTHLQELQALAETNRALWLFGFSFTYLLYVGFFLPGTAVLSVAGGALFGFWLGLAAVCLARTLGAVVALLLAKSLLRNWVRRRYAPFAAKLDSAMQRDGAYYFFFLRLAPVAPYNMTNLAMGLTDMRLSTYFWVTFVGTLPRTALWVNAGGQLATIDTLGDVMSLRIALSLIALGAFPLLMKYLVAKLRARG